MNKMTTRNLDRSSLGTTPQRLSWLFAAAAACLLALPVTAQAVPAGGVALSPAQLSSAHRQKLLRAVAQARQEHPEAFAAVAKLREGLPQQARLQRGRVVTLIRPLRAIGKQELMALLAELAVKAPARGALSARAWQGWQISLLEAVGSLRDRRALPVLWGILEHNQTDPVLARSAATALARLNDEKVGSKLIRTMGQSEPALRRAILPALGECRRLVAARELARVLKKAEPGSPEQEVALRALGQVGNAGAWRTPAVKRSGEGEAVRRAALKAVVEVYPRLEKRLQSQAYRAVLLIDHPKTAAILAAARQEQTGAAREALDRLADRVTRARTRR